MKNDSGKDGNKIGIVELITENNYFLGDSLIAKLNRRFSGFKFVLNKQFSFLVFLGNFLPFSLRPKNLREEIYKLQSVILDDFLKNKISEPTELLDFKFYFNRNNQIKNFWDSAVLTELVKEIIISDQYLARRFLKEDSIIIDAGANIGVFSVFAASLSPKGKVFSFEPSKSNYEVFKKTINFNNLSGKIILANKALGEIPGEGNLLICENNESGDTLEISGYGNNEKSIYSNKEKIEIESIDNFVKNLGLNKIDFIKIDTEGFEKQILKGAAETIKKFSPIISASAYHFPNDDKDIPKIVLSINPNYSYKIFQEKEKDIIFYPKELNL